MSRKSAFNLWDKAKTKGEGILEPCNSGSGAAAALGNTVINLCLSPITIPLSLPFFGAAKIAEQFFKKEHQVVIPIWTPEGSRKTNEVVPKISDIDMKVLVVPDELGSFTFPNIGASKDGWPDVKSLGMENGIASWICNAWDERRNVYVTYHLLMKGIVSNDKFAGSRWTSVRELSDMIPESVVKKIQNHPNYFEFWKGMKFDLTIN